MTFDLSGVQKQAQEAQKQSQEYGNSKYRILLTGHKHTIKSEDLIGLVHYELPTVGEGDKYEQDNLYLGNQKGIHLYEFDTDKLNAIYYL